MQGYISSENVLNLRADPISKLIHCGLFPLEAHHQVLSFPSIALSAELPPPLEELAEAFAFSRTLTSLAAAYSLFGSVSYSPRSVLLVTRSA